MALRAISYKVTTGTAIPRHRYSGILNLFVSDGSLFSSSAAANPTLTIVALAIRQADHITERMQHKQL